MRTVKPLRRSGLTLTQYIVIGLALCTLIVYIYGFFVVKPAARVYYAISQNTIYVNPNSGECYITLTVQNTGTVDFKIEAIVIDKDVIKLPVKGMLGSTTVRVGQRVALRIPLPKEYEPGTVHNVFLKTTPPFLEAQKFVVATTPVEEIG